MKLSDIIVRMAEKGVSLQELVGAMPAGCNGPWGDADTAVRNTAHWTITFLKAYELTGLSLFRDAAFRAAEFLVGNAARPMDAAFWCRIGPEKDFSNGLVGQAWGIEALSEAGFKLAVDKYASVAKDVFLLHPFNESLGLWYGLNVDGSRQRINDTFNQQLWLATSGMLICRFRYDEEIVRRVNTFLSRINENMFVGKDGLIGHGISHCRIYGGGCSAVNRFVQTIADRRRAESDQQHERSVGYHSFNLYAIAMLKRGMVRGVEVPSSEKIDAAIRMVESKSYLTALLDNRYGMGYNPAGFEIAYMVETYFPEKEIERIRWINMQLENHYEPMNGLMCRNTPDPITLSARLYEATRLKDCEVDVH